MALLALLAIVVVIFAYALVTRLPLATGLTAEKREHNATVMSQAKQALIGWMVLNAAQTDNNPGRLPCPEGVNNIGTTNEGIAAPSPGNPCATVGRLPWRTLGLDKLVDADAEPLWYAVSPGWRLQLSTTTLTINSDTRGQMTVDGLAAPNDVIALIIAPGRPMNVLAAPGCTARSQARAAPGPAMDPMDYIECFNAATPAFSTSGPAQSFNDQVLRVTTGDLMPALEAAIAQRMQREIAPALKSVYSSAAWGQTAGNPLYPFAARFDDPHPGAATYRGEDGRYRGLLPFNCSAVGCASDSRYSPTFVNWTNSGGYPTFSGSALLGGSSCDITGNVAQCTGTYLGIGTMTFTMSVRAENVAMALRRLDITTLGNVTLTYGSLLSPLTCSSTGTVTGISAGFQNDGSAVLAIQGEVPGLIGPPPTLLPLTTRICMTVKLDVLADHSLLDPSSANATGWFGRNEWYRLIYYAAADRNTADNPTGSPPVPVGCTSTSPGANCLGFNGTRNIRALLVLAGRSMTDPASRPSAALSDYLEFANCDPNMFGVCNPGTSFEQRPMRANKVKDFSINAPFNDRVVLVDWVAPAPTFPIAVLP